MKKRCVILGVVFALYAFGADKGAKMQIQLSLNDKKPLLSLKTTPPRVIFTSFYHCDSHLAIMWVKKR